MRTVIRFYKTDIKYNENMIIENFSTFLNAKYISAVDYAEYIKPENEVYIKINSAQSNIDKLTFDYLVVQQTDGTGESEVINKYYYYVVGDEWTSSSCIKLHCMRDVLNEFNEQYKLSDKTMIERQHEDRVKRTGREFEADIVNDYIYSQFSKTPEDLSPAKYKVEDSKVVVKRELQESEYIENLKWYLIYRTTSGTAPGAKMQLCAEERVNYAHGTPRTTPTILETYYFKINSNKYYYTTAACTLKLSGYKCIGSNHDLKGKWTDNFATITIAAGTLIKMYYEPKATGYVATAFLKSDGINISKHTGGTTTRITIAPTDVPGHYIFWSNGLGDYYKPEQIEISTGTNVYFSTTNTWNQATIETFPNFAGTEYIKSIYEVDRSESDLIKIVECPYCPIDIQFDETTLDLVLPEEWSFTSNILENKNLNTKFERTLTELDLRQFVRKPITLDGSTLRSSKRDWKFKNEAWYIRDPKMYTGDCYAINYVYDSNIFKVPLETYDIALSNMTGSNTLSLQYKQANNVSSELGFKFDWSGDTNTFNKGQGCFDQYLLSARNNELYLTNDEYLNYMRNGYNYDKETLRRSQESATTGNVVKTIAGIAQIVGGIADIAVGTKGIGGALIASGVATMAGATGGWIQQGQTAKQGEADIQQKINEAKAKSTTISNVNNIDLFDWYSDNKLRRMTFAPTDEQQNMINDYFSLFGYTKGTYGVPDLDSRYFYNYCRCNADIENAGSADLPLKYKEVIGRKYSEGVYKIHNRPKTSNIWDIERSRQNYEVSLVPISWLTSDLTNTKWLMNDVIDCSQYMYEGILFIKINEQTYTGIRTQQDISGNTLEVYSTEMGAWTTIYNDASGGWLQQNYRNMELTEQPNTTLGNYLARNGKLL